MSRLCPRVKRAKKRQRPIWPLSPDSNGSPWWGRAQHLARFSGSIRLLAEAKTRRNSSSMKGWFTGSDYHSQGNELCAASSCARAARALLLPGSEAPSALCGATGTVEHFDALVSGPTSSMVTLPSLYDAGLCADVCTSVDSPSPVLALDSFAAIRSCCAMSSDGHSSNACCKS